MHTDRLCWYSISRYRRSDNLEYKTGQAYSGTGRIIDLQYYVRSFTKAPERCSIFRKYNRFCFKSVPNVAARVICHWRKYDSITTTIRNELYWLHLEQRTYELCRTVFTVLNDLIHATSLTQPVQTCRYQPSVEESKRLYIQYKKTSS